MTSFGFAYPGCPPLLAGVDWRLEQGAFALLVGLTGSGKTTLLRCLKPELSPAGTRRGSIVVFDKDIESLQPLESAQCLGYVGQDPDNQIVCDTVWHELAFGMENSGFEQNLMRRRLAEIAHFFGMESWMHQKTSTLSGGEKQLVTLASVLALRPKLVLLDEPTAQLDPVAEKNFLHALFRINKELGITVVVATHSPHTMQPYATDAFLLEDGGLQQIEVAGARGFFAPLQGKRPLASTGKCSLASTGKCSLASTGKCPPINSAQIAVSLREVHFSYDRSKTAVLRDLSLEITQNHIHALVGGNGCGKSTLLRVAAKAFKPQHGRVDNLHEGEQALLPQNPKTLFVCDTVEEELREWQSKLGYTEAEIQDFIETLALRQLLQSHPYDISSGQQQLVAFAKLLLTHPKLLLLDEPIKGLDAIARKQLVGHIAAFKQSGGTVILATHDLRLVEQMADQVSLIFDGEIACSEPAEQFFENNLFYRAESDQVFLSGKISP